MDRDEKKLIVYPGAIINYQEKVAFKIPPSIYPTQVDIRLFYDKTLREFKALCSQTSVVVPERRIRGVAALLEDQVQTDRASVEKSLVVGQVVPAGQVKPVFNRRRAEAARRAAGQATCKPLKTSQKKKKTSGEARQQYKATAETQQSKTQEVPAGNKRTGDRTREPGLLKRLCLGINKEVLKKTNTSVVNINQKKTTVQKVETQTTTRNIVVDGKSGRPVIVKDPKAVHKKVEVSERVVFGPK